MLPLAGMAGARPALALEPARRVGGAKLRLSLNAYSFARLLNDRLQNRGPGLSLIELAEFCAKHDFDGLDATAYYYPGYRERTPPPDKFLFEFKKR
ncbi:MAG: hypothetical protein WD941_05670 [Opitutus sp.]